MYTFTYTIRFFVFIWNLLTHYSCNSPWSATYLNISEAFKSYCLQETFWIHNCPVFGAKQVAVRLGSVWFQRHILYTRCSTVHRICFKYFLCYWLWEPTTDTCFGYRGWERGWGRPIARVTLNWICNSVTRSSSKFWHPEPSLFFFSNT